MMVLSCFRVCEPLGINDIYTGLEQRASNGVEVLLTAFLRASFVACDHIEPMPSKSALPSGFLFVLRVPAARYVSDSSESST